MIVWWYLDWQWCSGQMARAWQPKTQRHSRGPARNINYMLSVRTAHPPPLTKIDSWCPKGVRRLFLDGKLKLFKASFRLYGIKHQIDGNHLYYFLCFATFGLLFRKLPGCLMCVCVWPYSGSEVNLFRWGRKVQDFKKIKDNSIMLV